MEKKVKFKYPMLPNFVSSECGKYKLDVGEFSETEIKHLCQEYQIALLEHSRKRKKLFNFK